MAKRAVLYARVSSEKQEEGTSLDGQLARLRQRAQERGYTVVEEVREVHTGADPNRPGLDRLRDMARAGQVDVIAVYALDRFMRDATQAVIVEYELEQAGAVIEYMDLPDASTGLAYRLTKSMLRELAQAERDRIVERTNRGRRDRVKQGSVITCGRPPYGYQSTRGEDGLFRLVPDESEAEIVRLIYQLYTVGDGVRGPLSLRAISKYLTALSVPTRLDGTPNKKRERGAWNPGAVGNILSSATYAGEWYYGKAGRNGKEKNPRETWIALAVPALIDRATWQTAQERRRQNRDMAARNTKRPYLLRRRVTCGGCGLKMQAITSGRGHPYYACPTGSCHRDDLARTCDLPSFRADYVDHTVWTWLRDLFGDEVNLAHRLRQAQADRERELQPLRDRLTIVDDLLAENRAQLARALDLYLSGDFDKSMLAERKNRLETTIAGLEAERSNLETLLTEQAFTAEQVQTIGEMAGRVRDDLALADDVSAGFEIRQRLVDLLDVQARLCVEAGERVAYVRCVIDLERRLPIVSYTTGGIS
jgi:site-specific DNA recombinase